VRGRGLWGAIINEDIAKFVIYMLDKMFSDLSKRMGDFRMG